jgi:hypothetical protein
VLTKTERAEQERLAKLDTRLRRQLASGWQPPWKGLELDLSPEAIGKMPTKQLAVRLWASGIHARELLLFDRPNSAMKRLEVCYKGYAELFGRRDLWEAMADGIQTSSVLLSADRTDRENRRLLSALTTLPQTYGYPPIRKTIAGHEKALIRAHVAALVRIKALVVAVRGRGASGAALVTPRTVIQLCESALALGQRISPKQTAAARRSVAAFAWRDGQAGRDIPRYVDRAVPALERLAE